MAQPNTIATNIQRRGGRNIPAPDIDQTMHMVRTDFTIDKTSFFFAYNL